jgi:hypothetical protein
MSGYFPTNAYEPVPEYDNNGYPVQQSPPQQSYGGAAWSQHTSYVGSQASPPYDDHEGLLKQQQQPSTPVIAQPTYRASLMYHPPVNHQLRHQYRKTKQFRRVFTRIMGRWLLSCLFAAAIVGIFIMYERMDVLDSDEKHMFNALYLGVSLLMALNMVVCKPRERSGGTQVLMRCRLHLRPWQICFGGRCWRVRPMEATQPRSWI